MVSANLGSRTNTLIMSFKIFEWNQALREDFHSDCTVSKILIVAKNSSPTLYQIKEYSLEDFSLGPRPHPLTRDKGLVLFEQFWGFADLA